MCRGARPHIFPLPTPRPQAQQAQDRAVAIMRQDSLAAATAAKLAASASAGGLLKPLGGSAKLTTVASVTRQQQPPQHPPRPNNPRLVKTAGAGLLAFSASAGSLPRLDAGKGALATAPKAPAPPPELSLHASNIGRYFRYTSYGALAESLLEERDALCDGLQQLRGTLEAWERGRIDELSKFEAQVRWSMGGAFCEWEGRLAIFEPRCPTPRAPAAQDRARLADPRHARALPPHARWAKGHGGQAGPGGEEEQRFCD